MSPPPCSTFEPDIINLQSWLATATDPDIAAIWRATKYLSKPYSIWLDAWRHSGCPEISMPAPCSEPNSVI